MKSVSGGPGILRFLKGKNPRVSGKMDVYRGCSRVSSEYSDRECLSKDSIIITGHRVNPGY